MPPIVYESTPPMPPKNHHSNKSTNEKTNNLKENQEYFYSFLDLIPAHVYFNRDDRVSWLKSKRSKQNNQQTAAKEPSLKFSQLLNDKDSSSFKLKRKNAEDSSDSEESESEEESTAQEDGQEEEFNRLDPAFFKSTSQVLKDLSASSSAIKGSTSLPPLLVNPKLRAQQQNGDSSKKVNNEKTNATSVSSSTNTVQTQIVPLQSEPKQRPPVVIKKRQRFDSHTEPQLIDLPPEASAGIQVKRNTQIKVENKKSSKGSGQNSNNNKTKDKSAAKSNNKKQKTSTNDQQSSQDTSNDTVTIIETKPQQQNQQQQQSQQQQQNQILNKQGQVVFSKFDFTADKSIAKQQQKMQHKTHHSKSKADEFTVASTKNPKDYKKLLKNLEERKEKLNALKESGETEKAQEMEEKERWSKAFDKASGVKVRDDIQMVKKSLKRLEKKKLKSKKGWSERTKAVEQNKQQRIDKREKNLNKRRETKKQNKVKHLKKKGRIVTPGF